MSNNVMKSLTDSVVLTVASRLMMAVGLPIISVLYFYTISKPIADLDVRITKIEGSDLQQHDQLLKQEMLLNDTNKSIEKLDVTVKDFSVQLRELNSYLAIQKDRDTQQFKALPR